MSSRSEFACCGHCPGSRYEFACCGHCPDECDDLHLHGCGVAGCEAGQTRIDPADTRAYAARHKRNWEALV